MKLAAAASITTLLTLSFTPASIAAIQIVGNNLGGSGRILADAAGTPLPANSLVRVGFFNDPVADIAVISGTDFSAIDAIFNSLGEGIANAGDVTSGALAINEIGGGGRFSVTISNITQAYLPPNRLMHYWVFNASSAASANQWAIFTNDDSNDGNDPWLSKIDDPGIPGSGDLSLAVQLTRVDDASDVLTGSLTDTQLRLAIIPEPTLASLIFSAAAALALRRRRA